MNVVNFLSAEYNNCMLSEDEYIKEIIRQENELECIMLKMYKASLRSSSLPKQNIEGCIETKIMRSVHYVMSKVRHSMKNSHKSIED